jgi:hypothetical protein
MGAVLPIRQLQNDEALSFVERRVVRKSRLCLIESCLMSFCADVDKACPPLRGCGQACPPLKRALPVVPDAPDRPSWEK